MFNLISDMDVLYMLHFKCLQLNKKQLLLTSYMVAREVNKVFN